MGNINEESPYYQLAYQYIRNISLLMWQVCNAVILFQKPSTDNILYYSTHENHFRKIQRKTHSTAKKPASASHYRYE
jgi:hypothetical protein